MTFAGDTASAGTGNFDTARGFEVEWFLASGSDRTGGSVPSSWGAMAQTNRNAGSNISIGDSTSDTWQITGVQLEVGDTATDFEHRSYGEELALCHRYFERFDYDKSGGGVAGIAGQCHETSIMYCALAYQPKRADPTMSTSTISGSNFRVLHSGTATNVTSFAFNASRNCTRVGATTGSGLTVGRAGILDTGSSQGQYFDIDAEL